MRLFSFISGILFLLFVSCQKTTDALPVETPLEDSTCRIIQMRQGAMNLNDSIFTYQYDDQNRLIRILHQNTDGEVYSYLFEYDGSARVKQILYMWQNEVVTKAGYTYNGTLLSKLIMEDYFIPYVLDKSFEYDPSGRLIKRTDNLIWNGDLHKGYATYEYDLKGNISRKRVYDNDTLEYIREFTYNDDENILKAFGLGTESIVGYTLYYVLDEDAYLNKNNLTSVIEKWPDGRIFSVNEITYIRDSTDRITRLDSKQTVGPFADGVFTYNFFYECK